MLTTTNNQSQIDIIIDFLGKPSDEDINNFPTSEKMKMVFRNLPNKEGKNIEEMFNQANPLAIDLLKRLLTFDQNKRITVIEALCHPYLQALHSEEDEAFFF